MWCRRRRRRRCRRHRISALCFSSLCLCFNARRIAKVNINASARDIEIWNTKCVATARVRRRRCHRRRRRRRGFHTATHCAGVFVACFAGDVCIQYYSVHTAHAAHARTHAKLRRGRVRLNCASLKACQRDETLTAHAARDDDEVGADDDGGGVGALVRKYFGAFNQRRARMYNETYSNAHSTHAAHNKLH